MAFKPQTSTTQYSTPSGYTCMGVVTQYPIVSAIYEAITNPIHEVGSQVAVEGSPRLSRLSKFITKNLRYVQHGGRLYVQQNKNSKSEFATQAKAGAEIVWVIRQKDGIYIGFVRDGLVYNKRNK